MSRTRPAFDPTKMQDAERGVVLVLFALFAVGLFALAATFVDLGLVRITQRSMQGATALAAREGLRWRDVTDSASRRRLAADAAAAWYDDDLDPTNGDALGLGAGPLVTVRGRGRLNALGLIEAGGFYDPTLQANVANDVHGDLVAGAWLPTGRTARPPGAFAEASDYVRDDFAPATPSGAPGAPAFLARLRRTGPRAPLDRIDGVSSAGPALPFLFGLGSAALQPGARGGYDPRVDGVTVRAASVARARPALRVSPVSFVPPGRVDLVQIAVPGAVDPTDPSVEALQGISLNEAGLALAVGGAALAVEPDGTLSSTGVPGTVLGRLTVGERLPDGRLVPLQEAGATVDPTAPSLPLPDAPPLSRPRTSVPVHRTFDVDEVEVEVVVGFASLDVTVTTTGGVTTISASIPAGDPSGGFVQPLGASASAASLRPRSLDPSVVEALATLEPADLVHPVLAPVRSL